MTFLLPQSEALEFSSDDFNSGNSLHDAFFDESTQYNNYDDLNDLLGFPLSPTLPDYEDIPGAEYEIVPDSKFKQEREGLRLKLRVSNSVSLVTPGSSGSSPNDLSDETEEVFNVEEFLNFPSSNDFVTLEESKQVAPSPAYSLSSYSTDPSPLHSSFSPGTSSSSDTCSPRPSNSSSQSSRGSSLSSHSGGAGSSSLSGGSLSSSAQLGGISLSGTSQNSSIFTQSYNTGELPDSTKKRCEVESESSGETAHSSSGKIYRYPSNIVPSKSVPGSGKRGGKFGRGGESASAGASSGSRDQDVKIVPSKSLPGQQQQQQQQQQHSSNTQQSVSGKVTKRKISGSSVSSSPKAHRKTASQVCKVTPVERTKTSQSKEKETNETTVGKQKRLGLVKKYYEQADIMIKNREKEIIEVEKKESVSKLKQGAVIGSMERGPRMFGVRYGPCDRPSLDDEELVTEVKPVYDVANRYKNTTASEAETTHGSQMVLNQQMKLNANSHSPKLPGRSFYANHNLKPPEISPKRLVGESSKSWSCPVPKAKIELPPYRPTRQTLKDGKCTRRNDNSNVIDLLYQKHLYCSVEKPLFESDPEILKASETYQMMLNTYVTLEAQRATAMKDIDKLGNLKLAAMKRPYKFIKQMKKGEIAFPQRQRIIQVPEVKLTHRNKELNLCHFKTPSGHMVTKPSEEFAVTTRLKKEPY